jgi:hypothetical protein
VVVTLKRTVAPALTLMSVAKPWSVASPLPVMSHSLDGFPVRLFSQTIAFEPQPCARGAELWVSAAASAASRPRVRRTNTCRRGCGSSDVKAIL